jgi:hypothetical protein
MYLGASLGTAFPLHAGERLQAGSGFGSPAFDLYPSGVTRPGVTVGAQTGYNWQSRPWVWGFETDFRRGGFATPHASATKITKRGAPSAPILAQFSFHWNSAARPG